MSVSTIDDVLAHYGIKGMKWGVRSGGSKPSSSEPVPVSLKTKPGRPIKSSGGKNQPVAEDAKQAAVVRQKARASGSQALSNKEMKLLIDRMNLEQQYSKLNPKQKSAGERYIRGLLSGPAPEIAVKIAKDKFVNIKEPNPAHVQRVVIAEMVAKSLKKKA